MNIERGVAFKRYEQASEQLAFCRLHRNDYTSNWLRDVRAADLAEAEKRVKVALCKLWAAQGCKNA